MGDINSPTSFDIQSVLKEILDEERAARRPQKRGHKRLDLVEPHTLAKTSDHPHHLVISSMKSHRTPKAPATFPRKPTPNVIMRFKARCKVCGEEDTWATQEVEGLDL